MVTKHTEYLRSAMSIAIRSRHLSLATLRVIAIASSSAPTSACDCSCRVVIGGRPTSKRHGHMGAMTSKVIDSPSVVVVAELEAAAAAVKPTKLFPRVSARLPKQKNKIKQNKRTKEE